MPTSSKRAINKPAGEILQRVPDALSNAASAIAARGSRLRALPAPALRALAVIALVRARRGDPDVWPRLHEAASLAEPTGELQSICLVAAAKAEILWLEGRQTEVQTITQAAFELALQRRAPWYVGELACWRRRAGICDTFPPTWPQNLMRSRSPGGWQRPAERWGEIGAPYETALALVDANTDEAIDRTLDELHKLGATAVAAAVTQRSPTHAAR